MGENKRTIAVVTGTRAEYGLLRRTMHLIKEDNELTLDLFVTGMHLSPTHGETYKEIIEDGFKIDYKIDITLDSSSDVSMAKSLGIGIMGFVEAFRNRDPDVVLVLGDRTEAFAAAIAASHMNIPVGHIAGGQISGGVVIDSQVRHAITKLSHIHFTSTTENTQRVERLGEEDWRIHPIGAVGVDDIVVGDYTNSNEMYSKYNLPENQPIVVVIYHPETASYSEAGKQMENILTAIGNLECYPIIIYPNSDLGRHKIINKINRIDEFLEDYTIHENINREDFLGLLNIADAMVGNSSSGLIEAPSFDLPVVNVGERQSGRQRTDNIVQTDHNQEEIREALSQCLHNNEIITRARECSNPYYMGGAAEQIRNKLKSVNIDSRLIEKQTNL